MKSVDPYFGFQVSTRAKETYQKLRGFMEAHVYPNEQLFHQQIDEGDRWQPVPVMEQLKARAKGEGLWNLFLPESEHGAGLTNLEYAPMAELMGRAVAFAPEIFNCSAPDTGNMEVLVRYGTPEQKERWLQPLLEGEIRSCFAMTEPDVASSDATNIRATIVRDGDEYVINGRKWWTSGAGDSRCKVIIFMGKTDPDAPKHRQQTMILVPLDAGGVKVERLFSVYGYDHAPHGHAEVSFENVRVPASNLLLGEGRGFEIAQGRLGPGRIHHCMRTIGVAEAALEKMVKRLQSRVAFGKRISEQSVWEQRIGEARADIEMNRLLCLKAADMMDKVGNKGAQLEIAMIKVAGPNMALRIIDHAIQAHGAGGVTTDFGLAKNYAHIRTLRLADGPDEVHNRAIARLEFKKYSNRPV